MDTKTPEVEVIVPARPGRRRRYSAEEKQQILREAEEAGNSISAVARRYGLSPSLMFRWRRLRDEGGLEGLDAEERGCGDEAAAARGAGPRAAAAAGQEDAGERGAEGRARLGALKKTALARELSETGRHPLKRIGEVLEVSRSNLSEERQPRRSYSKADVDVTGQEPALTILLHETHRVVLMPAVAAEMDRVRTLLGSARQELLTFDGHYALARCFQRYVRVART